jgi:ketosteroid isomerase-like protein
MLQENVEIVRTAYDAFARGDMPTVLGQLDPTVVSYTASPLPDPGEYRGHEGFLRWVENWTAAFDQFAMDAEEYTDVGQNVVVRARQRATGASSGTPVEQTFWLLHVFRNGRISRIGIHATEDQALEAAGLRE